MGIEAIINDYMLEEWEVLQEQDILEDIVLRLPEAQLHPPEIKEKPDLQAEQPVIIPEAAVEHP